jgi:hypothetical protein
MAQAGSYFLHFLNRELTLEKLEKFEDNKRQSETIMRTDNTVAKGKGHTIINKTLHKSLKIEKHELHLQPGKHPSAS